VVANVGKFIRDFQKRGQLYSLGGSELQEVNKLIVCTWEQRFVGHGKDAQNLTHKNIQVRVTLELFYMGF
jgi:hypothetical protein